MPPLRDWSVRWDPLAGNGAAHDQTDPVGGQQNTAPVGHSKPAAEKEAWISAIPDNISALAQEYFIEPEDYDSYEDFIEAVKDELG